MQNIFKNFSQRIKINKRLSIAVLLFILLVVIGFVAYKNLSVFKADVVSNSDPVVLTVKVGDITDETAVFYGNIVSDGGSPIIKRGVRYGMGTMGMVSPDFLYDTEETGKLNTGNYTYKLNRDIYPTNDTNFAQAYVMNANGNISLGEWYSFNYAYSLNPNVMSSGIVQLANGEYKLGGIITDDHNLPVTDYGFAYEYKNGYSWIGLTDPGPGSMTIDSSKKNFSATVKLKTNTTYHYWAYATNNAGRGLGQKFVFTTPGALDLGLFTPSVETLTPIDITLTSVTPSGNIMADGGVTITRRGFQYGLNTTSFSTTYETGTLLKGSFTKVPIISGLKTDTTYYIRAYAVNTKGTGFGKWIIFRTLSPAITVTALPATGITDSSAKLNGSVVASSNTSVTGRGFKYWKNPNPKDDPNCGQPPVSTNQVDTVWVGYGVGNFSFTFGQQASPASPSAQPLYSDTFYCYGALATDSQHNNFSSSVNKPFKTLRITATNWAANPVAQTTATLRGYVDKPVDSQFFSYGINPDPVGDPSCSKYVESYNPRGVSATNSNGKLAAPLTGLTPNTNYCYSAQIITIRDLIYPKSPDGKRVWRAFKTLP